VADAVQDSGKPLVPQGTAPDGVGAVIPDFTNGEGPGKTNTTELEPTKPVLPDLPKRLSRELSGLSKSLKLSS